MQHIFSLTSEHTSLLIWNAPWYALWIFQVFRNMIYHWSCWKIPVGFTNSVLCFLPDLDTDHPEALDPILESTEHSREGRLKLVFFTKIVWSCSLNPDAIFLMVKEFILSFTPLAQVDHCHFYTRILRYHHLTFDPWWLNTFMIKVTQKGNSQD